MYWQTDNLKKNTYQWPPRSLYSSFNAMLCCCCWKDISNLGKPITISGKFFEQRPNQPRKCWLLPSHSADWARILASSLLSQLQGCPGRQKIQKNILKIKLLSFCARIELKLKKLQKTVKTEKKIVKNACFLTVFLIFFNLDSIFVHQTSMNLFSE